MKQSKTLAVGLIICTALFILTASIAAPILIRPFYYMQIEPLGIREATGLSMGQIRQAYDEMLDFCTGRSIIFSTGDLAWSEWGRSHFIDVKGLFQLDLWALFITGVLLAAWAIIQRKAQIRPCQLRGRSVGYWAGSGLLISFILVGGLAALDFSRAFTIFHKIFFPGKDNWIFNPEQDEIITILPEAFFRNCAILILVLIIGSCTALIIKDIHRRKRESGRFPHA